MAVARRNVKRNEGKYLINRFPICEIVYYAVARKAGYDDDVSRALGHATAIFFALAKNRAFKGSIVKKNSRKNKLEYKENENPTLRIILYDRIYKAAEKDGKIYPKMGDNIITEDDFNKSVEKKLGKEKMEKMLEFAKNYMNQFDNITNPFKIYESVRDVWRTKEFIESL